ncbi:MAG: tryptophan--tRNA ligase, partial [Vibrio litoralis]
AGVEMYGPFKKDVGEAIVAMLEPIQSEYKRIREDRAYMDQVMKIGAEKASAKAAVTLAKAYQAVGFVPRG